MTCECCGSANNLGITGWKCWQCPSRHVVCLICLGKVSAMEGVGTAKMFLACPKSFVVAYDLCGEDSLKVKTAAQWTAWWTHATR